MTFFNLLRDMLGFIPLFIIAGFFGFAWFITTAMRLTTGAASFPLPVNLMFFAVATVAAATLIFT